MDQHGEEEKYESPSIQDTEDMELVSQLEEEKSAGEEENSVEANETNENIDITTQATSTEQNDLSR